MAILGQHIKCGKVVSEVYSFLVRYYLRDQSISTVARALALSAANPSLIPGIP